MSSQNLVRMVWLIKSGACEGKRGRTRRNIAKKRALNKKCVKDLPWHLGFGLIGELLSPGNG